MANKKIMTKEELQAKHRLEEAQMRDRAKERKARTRRLRKYFQRLSKWSLKN